MAKNKPYFEPQLLSVLIESEIKRQLPQFELVQRYVNLKTRIRIKLDKKEIKHRFRSAMHGLDAEYKTILKNKLYIMLLDEGWDINIIKNEVVDFLKSFQDVLYSDDIANKIILLIIDNFNNFLNKKSELQSILKTSAFHHYCDSPISNNQFIKMIIDEIKEED